MVRQAGRVSAARTCPEGGPTGRDAHAAPAPASEPKPPPKDETNLVSVEPTTDNFLKTINGLFAVTFQVRDRPAILHCIEESNLASRPSTVRDMGRLDPGDRLTIVAMNPPFPTAMYYSVTAPNGLGRFGRVTAKLPEFASRAGGGAGWPWVRREPLVGKPGELIRLCQFSTSAGIRNQVYGYNPLVDREFPLVPLPDGTQDVALRWTVNLKFIDPERPSDDAGNPVGEAKAGRGRGESPREFPDFHSDRFLTTVYPAHRAALLAEAKRLFEDRSFGDPAHHKLLVGDRYRQLAGAALAQARQAGFESDRAKPYLAEALEFARTAQDIDVRPEGTELLVAVHAARGEFGPAHRHQAAFLSTSWIEKYYSPTQVEAARQRLAAYKEQATPQLAAAVKKLEGGTPAGRLAAVREVVEFGPLAESALPVLEKLKKDDDETVRAAAELAILLIRKDGKGADPWSVKPVRTLGAGRRVAFSPNGDRLVAVGGEGIESWEVETGKSRGLLLKGKQRDYRIDLADYPNGQVIVALGPKGLVSVLDAETGRSVASSRYSGPTFRYYSDTYGRHYDESEAWNAAAFSPDGRLLAVGGTYKAVVLCDATSGEVTAKLEGHTRSVSAVAFSPDGSLLATAGWDGKVNLWDVKSRSEKPLATLDCGLMHLNRLAFHPDGKTLATGGGDSAIRLWTVPSGQPAGALRGHTDAVRSISYRPDGKVLASGSEDGTIRFWETATGWQIGVIGSAHEKSDVECVRFSPDGKTLASAGADNKVKLWDVPQYGTTK